MRDKTFAWASGDKLSVWPLSVSDGLTAQQLEFTLTQTEKDKHYAEFEGTGWALICDGSHGYFSYYPYNADDTQSCATITYPATFSIPMDWNARADLNYSAAGEYMYLYAPPVKPQSTESVIFNFSHISCMALLKVAFPESATGKKASSIKLSSDSDVFTLKASYNPSVTSSDESPVFTRVQTADEISVKITNGVLIKSGVSVVFALPMFPAMLKGMTLDVQVCTADGTKYDGTYTCSKNQESGKQYSYPITSLVEHIPDSPKVAVDLGTGIYWATVNLGAEEPQETGYRINWGVLTSDISGDWTVYKYGDYKRVGSSPQADPDPEYAPDYGITKYNKTDGLTVLEAEDDAVRQLWGDGWRMPTYAELNALNKNCNRSEKTTLNGVEGFYFSNPDDPSQKIFLPFAMYWSATLYSGKACCTAYSYLANRDNPVMYSGYARTYLNAVRPVKDK